MSLSHTVDAEAWARGVVIKKTDWLDAGWAVYKEGIRDPGFFPPVSDMDAQRQWLGGFGAAWVSDLDDDESVVDALARVLEGRGELLRQLRSHTSGERFRGRCIELKRTWIANSSFSAGAVPSESCWRCQSAGAAHGSGGVPSLSRPALPARGHPAVAGKRTCYPACESRRQIGALIQRYINNSKPRMRCEIRLGFGDDEPSQPVTC